ncbi:MAG: reverse transcriptase/maturase family protein [Candidatus Paceibacterota bacterium]|jgi:retron-type reverse transcriptase
MTKYKIPSFDEIISLDNLFASWNDFKRDKKNKADVALFAANLITNLSKLERELKSGFYRHGPYYHFKISDPKPRDIHKASVRDRVVHHAIYRALYPYFESLFIFDSYSCRLKKGTHRALGRLAEFANRVSKNQTLPVFILKGDIKKCFASIDHLVLKSILAKQVKDQKTMNLLNDVISSFSPEGKKIGLPLGNLTSQLFVNVYLNEFDRFVKHRLKEKYYIRYTDDFVILSRDQERLKNLISQINLFLAGSLKLTLHPTKVSITTFSSGADFLGWVHFFKHRVLRTVTKKRMFIKIKDQPSPAVINSYLGLLSHGQGFKLQERVKRLGKID